MIGNLKDETETENTKIDRKIRAYSKDLNLTKSIIRGTANNMERNLRLLNEDKREISILKTKANQARALLQDLKTNMNEDKSEISNLKTKANQAEVLLQGLNQQIKSLNDTMRETENKLKLLTGPGSEKYVKMLAGTLELKGGSTYTRGNVFALNSRGRMGPVRIVKNLSQGD